MKETGAEVDFPDRVQGQLRPDPGLLPSTAAALPLAGVLPDLGLVGFLLLLQLETGRWGSSGGVSDRGCSWLCA